VELGKDGGKMAARWRQDGGKDGGKDGGGLDKMAAR
jgi:hypothetical protein